MVNAEPDRSGRARRSGRQKRNGQLTEDLVVRNSDLGIIHSVETAEAESVRYLLRRLQVSGGLPHRFAFVSALSGEGVTRITRSVGAVAANDTARRVCVVEINWWTPSTDVSNEKGLGIADVVSQKCVLDDALTPAEDSDLWFLPAGEVSAVARPMATNDGLLAPVMAELAERFDHVIFDLPAVLLTSDAIALSRWSDSYALVVRQGVATRTQVRAALADLVAVPCAGIVLNAAETRIPRFVRRLLGD